MMRGCRDSQNRFKNSEDNSDLIESEDLIDAEIDESFDEPLKEAPEIRHLDLIDKEIRNVFCPSGYNVRFRIKARQVIFKEQKGLTVFLRTFTKSIFTIYNLHNSFSQFNKN